MALNLYSIPFHLVGQDLGSGDLRKDVYIVVHIVRIGRSYDTGVIKYLWLS